MLISMLPDETRLQTLKPYFEKDRYRVPIHRVSRTRGVERALVILPYECPSHLEAWQKVHAAFLQAVCELTKIRPDQIIHANNQEAVMRQLSDKFHDSTPQQPNIVPAPLPEPKPVRRWPRLRADPKARF